MRLQTLISLIPAIVLCSPLQGRQIVLPTGQTVKQDVINIHNAVLELDAIIQKYQGAPLPTSIVEGTPVLLGVAKIHEVNRAGFRHAVAALPFTVKDSRQVIDTVSETGMPTYMHRAALTGTSTCEGQKVLALLDLASSAIADQRLVDVSIPNATEHLKAKVEEFKKGGLVPVVIASLTLLLSDHDTFSAATLLKVNPGVGKAKLAQGTDAVANIHNAIADAILFYGGSLV